MQRTRIIRPAVEALESRLALSQASASVATAAHLTGTVPITANVRYDATTGVNLITATGRGTITPLGAGTTVQIAIVDVALPGGGAVVRGGIYMVGRSGTSFAPLKFLGAPTTAADPFAGPLYAFYQVTQGPGLAQSLTGSIAIHSSAQGRLLLTFDAVGPLDQARLATKSEGGLGVETTRRTATAVLVNNWGGPLTNVHFTHNVGLINFTPQETFALANMAAGTTHSLPVSYETGFLAYDDSWTLQFTDSSLRTWYTNYGTSEANLEFADENTYFPVTIQPYPNSLPYFTIDVSSGLVQATLSTTPQT